MPARPASVDTLQPGEGAGVGLGLGEGVREGEGGQEGPPGQGAQVAFPGGDQKPSGQHTPAPASEKVLAAQAVQEAAPGWLKVPAAHSAGCALLFATVALQKEPAGQRRGSVPHMKNPDETQEKVPLPLAMLWPVKELHVLGVPAPNEYTQKPGQPAHAENAALQRCVHVCEAHV